MKYLSVAALIILVFALIFLDDVNARGGRGGGRSSGRKTRGRTRTSKGAGCSFSKPKITKNTKIPPTRFRSPVIKSQATPVPRTRLFIRFAAGYLVTRYILIKAPVYRGGFPVHGSYVSIPENRAVRLSSERVRLLDSSGDLCLGFSRTHRTLKDGIENNLIELDTTVQYKDSLDNAMTLFGVNNTVSLKDIKEKNFTVTTRARYNVTVVDIDNTDCSQVEKQVNGTMVELFEFNPNIANIANISKHSQQPTSDCSQVEKQVNGTMVELFEFNPNTANKANIDFKLLVTSFTLIGILNCFKYF